MPSPFRLLLLVPALTLLSLPVFLTPASSASTDQSRLDWDPVCYRTYEQTQGFLQNIASTYPQIATLTSAGTSWEGTRQLWLLTLTNPQTPGPKPSLYLLAGQNPLNIAGPQILMRYGQHLAQGYGTNPDITYLLDNHVVHLLPVSNPDGYRQVYVNGYNTYNKNTRPGCSDPRYYGIDLNRNYPLGWLAHTTNPCDSSYPGTAPLTEPESQSILASIDNSGTDLVLAFGAPGPTLLYPWGHTQQPPPDAAGLDALAYNLGRLNSTPRNSVRQHNTGFPHNGLLDDTVYGTLDTPAFTSTSAKPTIPPALLILFGTSNSPPYSTPPKPSTSTSSRPSLTLSVRHLLISPSPPQPPRRSASPPSYPPIMAPS
jgi:hypothetical protein